jgi:flagellar FliL protein
MAKPNQPKEIKPKTEGEEAPKAKAGGGGVDGNMKVIIINLISTVLICTLFLSVNYILQSSLLSSKLAKAQPADAAATADDGSGGESDQDAVQKGVIVDLGDFILNLSDVNPRKYLKVNVSLEVSTKPEDSEAAAPAKKEGGEGGGGAAAASPMEAAMAQYKPAMRDAIITTLSSKTSSELSTVAGKELAKEQISDSINSIFAGDRDVLRVSFGDFIIQ